MRDDPRDQSNFMRDDPRDQSNFMRDDPHDQSNELHARSERIQRYLPSALFYS
jgi:hypothetical protein